MKEGFRRSWCERGFQEGVGVKEGFRRSWCERGFQEELV